MPSKQAMEAAVEIVNGDGKWESDPKEVKRAAKIIDAAIQDAVAKAVTSVRDSIADTMRAVK